MSFLLSQCPNGRLGMPAPPTDRSLPTTAPAPLHRFHPLRRMTYQEGLPPCAASALRRRVPTAGGAAPASAESSRADKLFELDKEGAYASNPSENSTPSGADQAGSDDLSLLDAGWGVVAVTPASDTSAKPPAKRPKKKAQPPPPPPFPGGPGARAGQQQQQQQAQVRTRGTPFVDKTSEMGVVGLSLLQQRLIDEGRAAHSPEQKAKVAAEAAARRERLAQTVRRKRDWVDPEDLDVGEGEAEEMSLDDVGVGAERQYLELNLSADGTTEVVEFDDSGRVKARRVPGEQAPASTSGRGRSRSRDEDDDDPLAFLSDLESGGDGSGGVFYPAEAEEDEELDGFSGRISSGAAAGTSRRSAGARRQSSLYDEEEEEEDDVDAAGRPMPGRDPLADEEIEWGLDELQPASQRPSLLRELGVIKSGQKQQQPQQLQKEERKEPKKGAAAAEAKGASKGSSKQAGAVVGAAGKAAAASKATGEEEDDGLAVGRELEVAWGGSGGASGIDMEQQEALLARLFKPHKVKELMAHQRAAEAEMAALKKKTTGRGANESRVDSKMRIVGGSAAGKRLVGTQGNTTRPMMEKVRQAIFNMMQARSGGVNGLPPTTRWLDCFAGTGSVGLEALSRGCREAHFVELDAYTCRKVLSRNIATCGFQRQAVIHTMKAEDFLRRAIDLPRFAGGAFDFISVTPPYLLVSYPELMDLLDRSPLIHDRTIVFVEYPKQLAHEVPPTLGSLVTVRDRKYGRTYIRVYGPANGPAYDDDDEEGGAAGDAGDDGDELLL